MKSNILKKIFNKTTLLIFIFGISFYFLNTGLMTTDDKVYSKAFNSFPTLVKWINEFYNAWSGRITLTLMINVFSNIPIIFFKLFNVSIFIILIFAMCKIASILLDDWNEKIKDIILIIFFCLIFFIPIPVINSGCLWLAGSMNYLLPLSLMLVAIIPFISEIKGKKINNKYYIFAIISNILACFAEQTSAILLVFGVICYIWSRLERREISRYLKLHLLIILIFTLINLLAPGNMSRSHKEMLQWYPSYEMLSLSDKLVQGYIRVANHLISDTTILFLIISILSSYFLITNKKVKMTNKLLTTNLLYIYIYIALVQLIFNNLLIKLFPNVNFEKICNKFLFEFKNFNIHTFYDKRVLIELIFSSYLIMNVAIQLIYSFKTKKTGIIVSILYCASICSSLVMSFSPTIFASGNRTFTVTDFLLVLISGILCTRLFNKFKEDGKYFKAKVIVFSTIIVVISVISYINLYKNGIQYIIY